MRSCSNNDIDLNITGHGPMKTVWENSERKRGRGGEGGRERERERERERDNHGVGRDVSFLLKQEKIRVKSERKGLLDIREFH